MTNDKKSIIRVSNQLTSLITLKNIERQEFYNDVNLIKSKQITNKSFIEKYDNIFNGNIAFYGKKAFKQYQNKEISFDVYQDKTINSFLGSVRRNINLKNIKKLDNNDYIEFNNDLRNETIIKIKIKKPNKINPINVKTEFHKFFKQVNYVLMPFGFRNKSDFIYKFKQEKQLKKFLKKEREKGLISDFDSDTRIGNFTSEISPALIYDLDILYNFFKKYYNFEKFRFSIGFSFDYEICDINGKNYKTDTFGAKTSLNKKNHLLFQETSYKINWLSEFFTNLMRSKLYFIYESKIFLTFYTESNFFFKF